MQWLAIIARAWELFNDPEVKAAIGKLLEWFQTLTPAQQAAYASRFETGFTAFGASHCPEDCPVCPPGLLNAETALLGVAKAA